MARFGGPSCFCLPKTRNPADLLKEISMTEKYRGRGDVIDFVTAGAVAVGAVVVMGHTLGVALTAATASGQTISVQIEGVFELPKVAAAVFVQGEKLIFDVSAASGAGEFDDSLATPASGDITGGAIAMRAGLNAETTCLVKLTPGNATKT
jgi:predicted RecA/RadA family phage recombinase